MNQANLAVQQAADLYSKITDIHSSLPASTTYWVERYVSAAMSDLWTVTDVEGFYAKCIAEACGEHPDQVLRIVSIGCGDAAVEIETCRRLLMHGHRNFRLEGIDVAEGAIDRGRRRAHDSGLADVVDLQVGPYQHPIASPADVVVANQMLHHVVDLEGLFPAISSSIGSSGIFVSADMIGRNGHMLWPEALAIMDRFWQRLPDKYKHNQCLGRFEPQYSNWDNSKEANEGIRAQDILALLLKSFGFEKFYAAGNLAVALFGRHFGYNFDPSVDEDRRIIEQLSELDFHLIDVGFLKPVLMYACMSNRSRPMSCYRHWTPEFCVRRDDPVALHYVSRRYRLGEIVEFSERMASIDCLRSGWSSPEVGGTWSNASSSEIVVPFDSLEAATQLRIFAMQYQPEGIENIEIEVLVNDVHRAVVRFPGHLLGPQWVSIPFNTVKSGADLAVRFKYPKTWSASELGLADDSRRLALRLIQIQLLGSDVDTAAESTVVDTIGR